MKKEYFPESVIRLIFILLLVGMHAPLFAQECFTVLPGSNQPICAGQAIELYATGSILPTDTFLWSNFDGSWTSVAQNPVIPVGTPGYAPGLFTLYVNSCPGINTFVAFVGNFTAGTATASQTICYNTAPAQLSATAPTGGVPPYTYQWQSSPDNSTWTNISAATNLTYQPGTLASTTYYKLSQTSSKCGTIRFTNVITITVNKYRRYVTVLGAGAKNGTSWSQAYDHSQLQTAINEPCVNEVWVSAGTYTPTLVVGGAGSRYKTFQMKNGVSVLGGFSGTETLVTQRNVNTNPTILSGDLNGDDNYNVTPWTGTGENCYHVFYHPAGLGLNITAVLDGFTIKGGKANGTGINLSGGGMYNVSATPGISNVRFQNNSADYGGAMYSLASNLILTSCAFTSNMAGWGGAISTNASSGQTVNQTLFKCSFTSNISTGGGGAINHGVSNSQGIGFFDCTDCSFVNNVSHNGSTTGGGGAFFNGHSGYDGRFTNCLFDGNKGLGTAYWGGGAFLIFEGNCTIINSTIVNSQSATNGGAISIYSANAHVTVQNSIFWNNIATTGNTIYNGQGGTATLQNSLIEDNSCPPVVNCGTGMIYNQNPLFISASDLHLQASSPAVNTGSNAAVPSGITTDLDGNPRFYNNGIVDMGAYENQDPCLNPTFGGTISSDQGGCSPFDPAEITVSAPNGYTGTLEYKWQKSVTGSNAGYTDIDASNAASYNPGALIQTTWYKRLVRVACQAVWTGAAESNAVTITVNPMPVLVTNQQEVCSPNKVNLTLPAVTAGSTLYGSALSYWMNAAATIPVPNPASVSAGTYYIKATANGGCFDIKPVIAKVNLLPTLFEGIGSGSYCANNPNVVVGLSGSQPGIDYTLWLGVTQLSPYPIHGTGYPIAFDPITPQTASYWVLAENTTTHCINRMDDCISITAIVPFVVSVSIATPTNPVPADLNVTFTATPVNGGPTPSYQWKVNGFNTGTNSPAFTYKPVNYDEVTCVLASSEACVSGTAASNPIVMTVTGIPVGNITLTGTTGNGQTRCYNTLGTITVAGNGTNYIVQPGGNATMIAGTKIIYKPGTHARFGSYMYGYISTSNHCGGKTPSMVTTLAGDDKLPVISHYTAFKLYPNPNTGVFTIEQTSGSLIETIGVEIYGMHGNKMMTERITGDNRHEFNVTDLPAGIYFVRIVAENHSETIKLVKTR